MTASCQSRWSPRGREKLSRFRRCRSAGPPARPRHRRMRCGFTVPEMLIALVIVALLLAALALAIQGVMQSYNENSKIAEVTQAARVVLNRMIREVRTADAVDSTSQRISIIPPANGEQVTQIVYELVDGELVCTRTVAGTPEGHVLLASGDSVQVDSFNVSRQTAVDGEGLTYTESLTAVLGLRVGSNAFRVTATACPRRNMLF